MTIHRRADASGPGAARGLPRRASAATADVVLVGGGLANSLIALRLRALRPEVEVLLLERDLHLGGRHTWSFHADDLTPEQHAWVGPLVAHSWPRQEVRFPAYSRSLESAYFSITSESLRVVVEKAVGEGVRTGVQVTGLSDTGVALGDGTRIAAGAVVDGRGEPGRVHLELGFQKFLGQILALDAPHGLGGPVLMDATVDQTDGFRFLYTLPFGERRLLVEDTRYSDTPGLEKDGARGAIEAYASSQGWRVGRVEGEEAGSLPIVISGDIEALWDADGPGVPRSGMRAALFHPTTGYSLPEAVRLADAIAASPDLRSPALYAVTRDHSREAWRRGRFFRLLNRMLFRAARPAERYRVLEHFYRLPEPLVGRFYAGRLTGRDKIRVLSGRPPVPVGRALLALLAPRPRPDAAIARAGGRT
jgi:lycopene beta-cyclase